jgi:hypothetical protein
MPDFPGIVAHVIVGPRQEPYLAAMLDAIADVASLAIINDNSGVTPGPNDVTLHASALASSGRLRVVRTTFSGFADARNACIESTPTEYAAGWALFVDADEIHGGELARIAALLPGLPRSVDAVDGYSRHFVGSFGWWLSLERRLCFFRLASGRRWSGRIHERLEPIGPRVALPAIWAHYGHVVTPRMEWEKSRLYGSLGQPGFTPTDAQLETVDAAAAWGRMRGDVMRFKGEHPSAARATIDVLSREWAATFAAVETLFSRCTPLESMRRGLRRANFARLVAMRGIEAGTRWGYSA